MMAAAAAPPAPAAAASSSAPAAHGRGHAAAAPTSSTSLCVEAGGLAGVGLCASLVGMEYRVAVLTPADEAMPVGMGECVCGGGEGCKGGVCVG